MSTVRQLLQAAAARLHEAGVASPEYDAAELLAHAVGTTRSRLPLIESVDPDCASAFEGLIRRRSEREPLQHLTGAAAFRQVELVVGPGVFVPRPETELLAGWVIERVRELDRPAVVVDLCTGSGAIAASVADEVSDAVVHAVELDAGALAWAERNLAGTGVVLHAADLADALPELDGQVDVVVCNPPYVPLEAWESVSPEAREHDPQMALFSGEDGLVAMRSLERTASRLLRPGGWCGAEHADVQGRSAPAVFASSGRWFEVRDHRDLTGRDRFLTARLAR